MYEEGYFGGREQAYCYHCPLFLIVARPLNYGEAWLHLIVGGTKRHRIQAKYVLPQRRRYEPCVTILVLWLAHISLLSGKPGAKFLAHLHS